METQTDDLNRSVAELTIDERVDSDESEIKKVMDELTEKAALSRTSGDQLSPASSPLDNLLRDKDSECEEEASPQEENVKQESEPTPENKLTDDGTINEKTIDPLMEGVGGKFDKKRPQRPRTEKWGESVGIVNEDGTTRRVIKPDELKNYLVIELGQRKEFKIYSALINDRFPRFLDSTIDYHQRWRMRYNLFADNVLEDETDDSLVHIGEIHLYFDLIPSMKAPYYMNSTFFENPANPEKPMNAQKYAKVLESVDRFRRPPTVLQLKFPVRSYLFQNTNEMFEKFEERQQELMEEARSVFRKAIIRKKRVEENHLRNGQSQSIRGPSTRYEDYDQSGRDSSRGNRRRPRNYRPMQRGNRDQGPGFRQNYRNEREVDEKQGSYGPIKRYGMNERIFRGSKRSDSRPNRKNTGNNVTDDVTFEDTQERQQRSSKSSENPKRPDLRENKRSDRFQAHDYGQQRRHRQNSVRSMDSGLDRRPVLHDGGQYSNFVNPSAIETGRHMQPTYQYPAEPTQFYHQYR